MFRWRPSRSSSKARRSSWRWSSARAGYSPRTPRTEAFMTPPETLTKNEQLAQINADYTERYGFHDAENYLYKAPKGLNQEIVEKISEFKNEPQWMRDFRLKAYEHFVARPQPTWGSPLLAEVDYDDIHYF